MADAIDRIAGRRGVQSPGLLVGLLPRRPRRRSVTMPATGLGGGDGTGPGGERLLIVVDPAVVGSQGRAPLVVATQTVRSGPGGRTVRFQAAVIEPRQLPLVIAEAGIPGPERGWELRASGLWAETVCEERGRRWTYGLEAFALAVDDPTELLGRAHGHRVPLGWELEFEAPADARPDARPDGGRSVTQAGTGRGLLLFAHRELEIEGPALRRAWTMAPDEDGDPGPDGFDGPAPTGPGSVDSGWPLDAGGPVDPDDPLMAVALPGPNGVWWIGRTASGVRTWHD